MMSVLKNFKLNPLVLSQNLSQDLSQNLAEWRTEKKVTIFRLDMSEWKKKLHKAYKIDIRNNDTKTTQ